MVKRSSRMKVAMVVGARPQFVKVSMLVRALKEYRNIETMIIHTGQHYDRNMSDIFFKELSIAPPKYNLGIGSRPHGVQTGRMLAALEKTLEKERPACVVVFGDTNSTLAGALAAAKMKPPAPYIVHVEAGVRSYNRRMPEEVNRTLTDRISDIHFCPSASAVKNLKKEGITEGLYDVGDIMYDSLIHFRKNIAGRQGLLAKWGLERKKYYLATVHRAGNTDTPDNLSKILEIFEELDLPVLFPAHPRTAKVIKSLDFEFSNIRLIAPLPYFDMLSAEKNARLIFTDSGGVQKEAFYLQIPCIVLRPETEWRELLSTGSNVLTGLNKSRIFSACERLTSRQARSHRTDLYGNGRASIKMARIIRRLKDR